MRSLLLSVPFLLVACGSDETPNQPASHAAGGTLVVTAIPDANKDRMREDQQAMADWLSKHVGMKVSFHPVENYAGAVAALAAGQADLAWLGGVTTVQAMQKTQGKAMPLVTRPDDLKFKSYVIAHPSTGAKTIADLKGKRFTFGPKGSTSGHVMPRHLMGQEHQIDPETFFASVAYSSGHDATLESVLGGAADAGVLNFSIYEQRRKEGKFEQSALPVVWTTPEYVDYAWVARTDIDQRLGAGTRGKIESAFLGLKPGTPADDRILQIQNTKGYIAAKAEWWDGIKAVLEKIDIGG